MGRNRRTRKPYTTNDRRKLVERVHLTDQEIYNPQELKERKSRIVKALRIRDRRIQQEQESLERRGTCPKCNIVRTVLNKCSMGCDDR